LQRVQEKFAPNNTMQYVPHLHKLK